MMRVVERAQAVKCFQLRGPVLRRSGSALFSLVVALLHGKDVLQNRGRDALRVLVDHVPDSFLFPLVVLYADRRPKQRPQAPGLNMADRDFAKLHLRRGGLVPVRAFSRPHLSGALPFSALPRAIPAHWNCCALATFHRRRSTFHRRRSTFHRRRSAFCGWRGRFCAFPFRNGWRFFRGALTSFSLGRRHCRRHFPLSFFRGRSHGFARCRRKNRLSTSSAACLRSYWRRAFRSVTSCASVCFYRHGRPPLGLAEHFGRGLSRLNVDHVFACGRMQCARQCQPSRPRRLRQVSRRRCRSYNCRG
mmetsp:Transcript_21772/g.54881  ORF Transcript_21772/g.54881 Transcript_21772/m.54881 type:complete len:304 (-) Transcript_21772:459-1370(-)